MWCRACWIVLPMALCAVAQEDPISPGAKRCVQGLHAAIYGPASQMYADDFTRTAQLYAEQKKPVPAIAMHQISLGIRTKIAGPLDPTLVPDLDRLGELYTSQRDYERAEEAYRHEIASLV